jgi:microcystin-dependent protein
MPIVKNNQPHVFSNSSIVIGKDDASRTAGLTVYGNISTNGSIKGGDLTVNDITANDAKFDQLTANNILGPALTAIAPTFVSCYNGNTVTGQKTYALNNEVGNNVLNYLVFLDGQMQPPTDEYSITGTVPNCTLVLNDVPTAEKKLTVLGLKNGNVTGSTGNTVNPALCATDYAPIGTVMYFARSTPPAGWLVCDGTSQLKSAFPDLAGVLGNTFGTSTNTTFVLPDLRGEFLRGWSNGRTGVDVGRVFGNSQLDELKSHYHLFYEIIYGADADNGGSNGAKYSSTQTEPTSSYGGTETRPRNVALLPCIKAFHSYALNSVPANISTITNNYVTKSDANKFVTTDNFLYKRNINGYQKLPGGIMLQWGKVTDSNLLSGQQPAEFDFHIPFSTTCYNLNCTIINDFDNNTGGNGHDNFIQIMTLQKNKFKVIKQEAGGGDNDPASFYWFAIGDY